MRNHDDGFVFEQYVEGLFDFVFVFGIGKGGCFIQYDDGGILQQGAGDGEPLGFSARDVCALGAVHRVDTGGVFFDNVHTLGFAERFHYLFAACIFFAVADIF